MGITWLGRDCPTAEIKQTRYHVLNVRLPIKFYKGSV